MTSMIATLTATLAGRPAAALAGVATALLLTSGTAHAQAATAAPTRQYEVGYLEFVAQSAFGNVTSQSFGVEGGYNVTPRIRAFAEIGLTRDTAPKTLGTAAQLIAGYLTQVQPASVSYEVAQPVRFASVGIKYMIPYDEDFEPYVLGGFGMASIKRDVAFRIAGNDVTDTLNQYGVVLGHDLAGSSNKGMVTLGGGVMWNLTKSAFLDLQYRYGRVLDETAFTVNRAGAGVGFRF